MTDFQPTHRTAWGTQIQALQEVTDTVLRGRTEDGAVLYFFAGNLIPLPVDVPGITPPFAEEETNDAFDQIIQEAAEDVEREEEAQRIASAQAYIRCDNSRTVLMEAVEAAMSQLDQGNYNTARAVLETSRNTAKKLMIP